MKLNHILVFNYVFVINNHAPKQWHRLNQWVDDIELFAKNSQIYCDEVDFALVAC